MGYFNEIGMHVQVNLKTAKEWYEKAAVQGNKDAQQRIEGLRANATLSKKDHEQVAINRIKSHKIKGRDENKKNLFKSSCAKTVKSKKKSKKSTT